MTTGQHRLDRLTGPDRIRVWIDQSTDPLSSPKISGGRVVLAAQSGDVPDVRTVSSHTLRLLPFLVWTVHSQSPTGVYEHGSKQERSNLN